MYLLSKTVWLKKCPIVLKITKSDIHPRGSKHTPTEGSLTLCTKWYNVKAVGLPGSWCLLYLGKTLLAVVLEVSGVDVDVVAVDTIRLSKLGRLQQKLVHLHRSSMCTAVLKRFYGDVRGRHTVWERVGVPFSVTYIHSYILYTHTPFSKCKEMTQPVHKCILYLSDL